MLRRPLVWLFVAGLAFAASPARGWMTPPNIHIPRGPQRTASGADQDPAIAFVGERGVAVWNDNSDVGSYRKWATTVDGGMTWSYGGDYWTPFGEEGGHVRMGVDAPGTFYLARLSLAGGALLSRGRFSGNSFAWDPEARFVDTPQPPLEHPWLEIDPASGALYYTYTQFADYYRLSRTVYLTRSLDGGATWSAPAPLSADSCSGSRAVAGPDGSLTVVWTAPMRNQVQCRRSTDQGATFGPVQVVGPFDDNINTLPPGETAGIVLDPRYPLAYTYPNWPALAVERSSGPHRGRLYAAWVQQVQGVPGPISGGIGESEPNDTPAQANPVSIGMQIGGSIPSSDFGPATPDYFAFQGQAGQTVMLTGRTQYSPPPDDFTPQGIQILTCGADTALVELTRVVTTNAADPVPPTILTLPATGRYVIRVGGAGPYSKIYSITLLDYARSAGSVARDHRDVALTWSDDGGATWSAPLCVSDGPARYTDALPQLLVDERGFVHVAWYDFRDGSECGDLAGVYWRMSTDGGVTFFPSQRISDAPSTWDILLAYATVGDHLAMTSRGNRLHFAWADTRDQMATGLTMGTEIYTAQIDADVATATLASVAAFAGWHEPGGVRLSWRVESPEQVREFRLERAAEAGAFEPVALSLPLPTRETLYEAVDGTATPGQAYRYRLELVLSSGGSRWSEPLSVAPGVVGRLALRATGPNPFADRLTMVLSNARAEAVEVTVHDVRGARVATLHRGVLPAGETRLAWSGRDEGGHAVPPGVYLVRAQGAGETAVQRVVRVH